VLVTQDLTADRHPLRGALSIVHGSAFHGSRAATPPPARKVTHSRPGLRDPGGPGPAFAAAGKSERRPEPAAP